MHLSSPLFFAAINRFGFHKHRLSPKVKELFLWQAIHKVCKCFQSKSSQDRFLRILKIQIFLIPPPSSFFQFSRHSVCPFSNTILALFEAALKFNGQSRLFKQQTRKHRVAFLSGLEPKFRFLRTLQVPREPMK